MVCALGGGEGARGAVIERGLLEFFEQGCGGGVFGDGFQSFDGGFEVSVRAEGFGLVETGALLVG